jgi:hypothetical protein
MIGRMETRPNLGQSSDSCANMPTQMKQRALPSGDSFEDGRLFRGLIDLREAAFVDRMVAHIEKASPPGRRKRVCASGKARSENETPRPLEEHCHA